MVTIKDVSKLSGISKSTVSRVVSENGYVSEEKREAVLKAIEALGFRPNLQARGLRLKRTNIIGGIVIDAGSPFFAQLIVGMQLGARDAGKSLLLSSGFADKDEEKRALTELVDRGCDGLLLNLEHPIDNKLAKMINRSGIPIVTIGTQDNKAASGSVILDNYTGAKTGMLYLLENNHRKIAIIAGVANHRDTKVRMRGISVALAEYNMTLADVEVLYGGFEEHHGINSVEKLVAKKTDITAIFAGDDDIAAGAILALKKHNYKVPEDVSVIGFDDNFHARHLSPGLTTIRQPIKEAGQAAAEILLQLINDEKIDQKNLTVPTELIVRGSVKKL